ncbi:MAG: DUF2497 domain-containing protein [Pseudomonadota bacterium]
MEEILASIRRIISEDGEPVGEASGGQDDEFAASEHEMGEPPNTPEPAEDGIEHLLSVDELLGDDLDFEEVEITVPEVPEEPTASAVEDHLMDDVFEDEAGAASYQSNVQPEPAPAMEANVSKPQPAPAPAAAPTSAAMETGAANALESFVRSMIEPMINEWLESNLEGIVNAKVDAELQRVATRVRQALIDQ